MFKIKDELHVVVSQKSNNVAERIIYTRDAKDEVELETFCNENRRIHPMQFLNGVREFSRFNSNSWEVKLLKILKCFKGNSEIWAEAVSYTHLDVYKRQHLISLNLNSLHYPQNQEQNNVMNIELLA